MTMLFGTDGIRGKANSFPLDDNTIFWVGAALALLLKRESRLPKVIIGHDTRRSGPQIEKNLAAGIQNFGGIVHFAGIIPTPGIAHLTRKFSFDAGIVISASHNPYQDNGIKIFRKDGFKLPQKVETKLEGMVFQKIKEGKPPSPMEAEKEKGANYLRYYMEFILSLIDDHQPFTGYKIVLDCANGATYQIAPKVFNQLGAKVDAIFTAPNGQNINHQCGALYPWEMSKKVAELGADLGVAFDGDGDRAILSDHRGNILDGDYALLICARHMKKQNKLSSNKIVATLMSNVGLEYSLAEEKLELIRAPVGDKYVLERMMQEGANLGGEQSGHLIFSDISTAGDGIITAVEILNIMRTTGHSLAGLAQGLVKYPQILLNIPVKEKPPLDQLTKVARTVNEVEKALNGSGRLLLRYSGTESVARIMIEGSEEKRIEKYAQKIAQAIKDEIGN